ncbi:unnamed protein product [Sphagnum jensenii]|uniref:Uncharacterized protein n=1 Tax=Sphagnum jensenii TaxID=128206 RepID=A0ABP1AMK9_9BRYO
MNSHSVRVTPGASIYSSGVSNTLFLTTAMVAEPCWQKNQILRWQTSNSEYGRFYIKMNKADVKQAIVHKDCERKCDELGSELQDCKAQINTMKLTDTHCSTTNDGPFVSVATNDFNGGKQHEPQMFEEHLKSVHPRLVKRVEPKNFTSTPEKLMNCCMPRCQDKSWMA